MFFNGSAIILFNISTKNLKDIHKTTTKLKIQTHTHKWKRKNKNNHLYIYLYIYNLYDAIMIQYLENDSKIKKTH